MMISLPLRLSRAVALAVAVAAVLTLVFASGADARRAACASSAHRSARACAQARRRRHRAKHAKHSRKHHGRTNASPKPGVSEAKAVPPVCEDGSKAVRSGHTLSCDDGSEPQCPLETSPVLAQGGRLLFCLPESEVNESFDERCTEASTGECMGAGSGATSACDDGSEAKLDAEGLYVCGDGTEPSCPEPAALTLTEDGSSLVCEPSEEAG